MTLPLFSNVRKLEGLGITLSDLLKQLNELRNKEPEVYEKIVEKVVYLPEYLPIYVDTGGYSLLNVSVYIQQNAQQPIENSYYSGSYIPIFDIATTEETTIIPSTGGGISENGETIETITYRIEIIEGDE